MSDAASEFLTTELSEERVQALLGEGGVDMDAVLTSLLWDGRTWMRRNAGLALKVAGAVQHEKLEALPVAAKDGDAAVRAAVVCALATVGLSPDKATPPLLRALADAAEIVRESALASLGRLVLDHPDAMVRLLIDALADPRPIVELTAQDLLLQAGEPATAPLVRALAHDNANVRYGVFAVLEQLGGAATDALVPALRDPRLRPKVTRLLEKAPAPTDAQRKALDAVVADGDAEAAAAARRILATAGRAGAAALGPLVFPHADFADRYLSADDLRAASLNGVQAESFVRALADGRPEVRANAARLLALTGEAQAVAALLPPLVRDGQVEVTRVAVELLAELGGEATVAPLVAAAAHGDPTVASTAWKALLALARTEPDATIAAVEAARADASRAAVLAALAGGGEAVVPACARALAGASHPPTRALCATALGRLGASAASAASALVSALSDATPEVREAAAQALGPIGVDEAAVLAGLRSAQADGELSVRRAATRALATLRGEPFEDDRPPREAQEPPIEGFATELLDRSTLESEQKALDPDALAELLADGRPVVRANAARGLSVLGARGRALGALRVVLKDSRPEVRLAAVEALAALGPAAAELGAADLVSRLGDRHPDVVTAAGEALRAMGEEALPALIAGLDGTARFVSQRLLPALALHGPAAAQALAGALGHGVAQIRARALEGLVVLGRPGATAAREAVAALMEDPASEVRSAAREVLDFIDGKQALSSREAGPMPIEGFDREALGAEVLAKAKLDQEWLAGAVRDGRVMVRRNAAVALGVTGHGREATTALGLALKDGMPEVRRVAASALGTLAAKDAGAAVALVPALADPVERVAEAAREAFAGLGASGVPALVAALDSGRAAVVDAALAALVAHGEAAVEPLVEVLGEGTVAARFQALRGLDALGVELATAARPAIEAALGHGSRDLRRAARALLDRLDGKGAGPAVFEAALMPVEGFDTGPLDGAVLEEASGAFDAEWLSRALRDGRSAVRANAARALPLCAKGVEARQPLAIALKDAEPEVRQAAAEALARLGRDDDAAIAALVPATFDATPEVGTAARRALEALGDDAVNGLVRALGSPRPQAVLGALELLRTRGKAAVKALLSALNDSSETMRLNAIRALGLVGAEAGEVVGARLLELAEGDPSGRVRRAAASARARIARPEPAARTREPEGFALEGFEERLLEVAALAKAAKSLDVDRLVRALGDGRAVVRANAARGLGVLGKAAHGAVRSLAVLMRDQEPPVRLAAAEALGSLAHEPDIAVVALTRALRDGPESLRPAVLAAVGAFGAAAAEPLMGMLAGVEDEVLATVGRVACHDPKRLVAPLVRQVSEGASPRHREHAIEVLGLVGPEAAAAEGALVEVLADTDSALRARAVRALGKVAKPTKALSERLAALAQSDGSLFVQQAVEQALGDLKEARVSEGGSPMDAPEVRRLLDELSALTRERPGDALRRALSERIERVRREELQRAEAERRAAVLARDVWPHLRRDAAERTLVEPEGHDFDLEGE